MLTLKELLNGPWLVYSLIKEKFVQQVHVLLLKNQLKINLLRVFQKKANAMTIGNPVNNPDMGH